MRSAIMDGLRVLPHVVGYEWRKASAFRLGLVLREVLRGVGRPLVMALVYVAMFESSGATDFRGYRLWDLIAYLVWTAVIQKCLTDERSLDLAEQIFEGYVTKYLVMPIDFFTLVLGRFVQFTLVQLVSAVLFWVVGALLLPAHWPHPVSATAFAQAATLLMMGAYCYLLVHFILNCLAFWLGVVWSLLNMFRFISMFISGMLVPIALMPDIANDAFKYLFPYWTVFAPAELLLGRKGTPDFIQGLLVLGISIAALQWLASFTWRRGTLRFAGAGS